MLPIKLKIAIGKVMSTLGFNVRKENDQMNFRSACNNMRIELNDILKDLANTVFIHSFDVMQMQENI